MKCSMKNEKRKTEHAGPPLNPLPCRHYVQEPGFRREGKFRWKPPSTPGIHPGLFIFDSFGVRRDKW
jgi:hypothetical protein